MTETPSSISVSRNSKELSFAQQKYKRGAKEGTIFYAPIVEAKGEPTQVTLPAQLASLVEWIGPLTLADWLQAKLNLSSQAATEESSCKIKVDNAGKPVKDANDDYVYEDKPFNLEEFKNYMSNLSTRGESKGELEERLNDLIDKAEVIANNPDNLPPTEHTLKFAHIMREMATVKHAIQAKKRKKDVLVTA